MKERISIIVPVYNVEKYLRQCLDSIINQTYKNLEIILADDGSEDSSGKICDEYAKVDNRIKVIHNEHMGVSCTRNVGLDNATGEYISFIDSDDCVAENFIETLYKLCIDNNCDISECDFSKFTDKIKVDNFKRKIKILDRHKMQLRLHSRYYVRTVIPVNKLCKRYLYENLRFPAGKIHEDEFITYKVFYNCKSDIVVSNEKLYYYRHNSQSITGSKFTLKRLDSLEALQERIRFYESNNEQELRDSSFVRYQNLLRTCYIFLKKDAENPEKELEKIMKEFKSSFGEYIYLHDAWKIKNIIFIVAPSLYYVLLRLKRKITGEDK